MAFSTHRLPLLVVSATLTAGLLASFGCEPRKKAAAPPPAGTSTVAAVTNTAATTPATASTTTPTTTTTATPTATTPTTAPTTAGTWPTPGAGGWDPAVLGDIAAKAAAAIGMPLPATGAPAASGDPLEAMIKTNAAKYAPGFTAASPIGRAKGLKTGEHAGMNVDMEQGKCYVVLGAGGTGVTQLGLYLLFPAAPPNAVMAQDTNHGNGPVLGDGKPLCPPMKSSVRVDTSPLAGAGDVAVQVWVK